MQGESKPTLTSHFPLQTSDFILPLQTSHVRLHTFTVVPHPPALRLLAALAVVFAVLTTANAFNKGGDALVFFEGGRRFLNGGPLYEGSSAADGFIGPPFQAMFFAPFAVVYSASPARGQAALARAEPGVSGCRCLAQRENVAGGARAGRAPRTSLAADALRAALRSPAARADQLRAPEHQRPAAGAPCRRNMATDPRVRGLAGLLIGAAAALKAFPALLILYFAARRYWTAALAAAASAVMLTLTPLISYGVAGLSDLLQTFWRLANSGWPIRGNNQSLIAAVDRLRIGDSRRVTAQACRSPATPR